MTTDVYWNPSMIDIDINSAETFYKASDNIIHYRPFDRYGEYQYQAVAMHNTICEPDFVHEVEFLDCDDMVDNLLDLSQPVNLCGTYGFKMASTTTWQTDFSFLHHLFCPSHNRLNKE
jgi:hypothetical protein